MKKELQQKLYDKYPLLFQDASKPMSETCMCWGISTGDGWHRLLDNLCNKIQHRIESHNRTVDYYKQNPAKDGSGPPEWAKDNISQVIFDQVKEKFGGLRIYHHGGDDIVSAYISFAESLSYNICEDCGKFDDTVGRTTKGWIHVICKSCVGSNPRYEESGWKNYEEEGWFDVEV